MIQLTNVTQNFGSGVPVLHGVDLKIAKGEFVYVLGGSGAGKSTLLRLIATETTPREGEVQLFGYSTRNLSSDQVSRFRQSIGYIPQDFRLIGDLTVEENIEIAWKLGNSKTQLQDLTLAMQEVLGKLKLTERRKVRTDRLSGGEAQRVSIARALIRKPEILIADEPTGAQDREMSWDIIQLLHQLHLSGSTVILATHDREIVRKLRKRCAVLKEGQLRAEDATWL